MNQLIPFIINHWMLWAALVIIAGLLIFEEMNSKVRGVQQVAPQQAINLINREKAIVVDVRDTAVFQTGHLTAAINITFAALEKSINKLTKYKNKPIILVCNIGQNSNKAGVILRQSGFDQVYSLSGGIAAWQKAGLPLVKN